MYGANSHLPFVLASSPEKKEKQKWAGEREDVEGLGYP